MRSLSFVVAALAAVTNIFAQQIPGQPSDAFQVAYAVNLDKADSVVNLTNAGTQNTATGALTNICANVYAFSPDEQMISCCSCPITPNALVSLSVTRDLISNTLTPARPSSIVMKYVATAAASGSCNAASAGTAASPLVSGMQGWGTTFHFPSISCVLDVTPVPANCACVAPSW